MTPATTLRLARPTDRLDEVVRFYTAGVSLTRLGGFEDHAGLRYRAPKGQRGDQWDVPAVSEGYAACLGRRRRPPP